MHTKIIHFLPESIRGDLPLPDELGRWLPMSIAGRDPVEADLSAAVAIELLAAGSEDEAETGAMLGREKGCKRPPGTPSV